MNQKITQFQPMKITQFQPIVALLIPVNGTRKNSAVILLPLDTVKE